MKRDARTMHSNRGSADLWLGVAVLGLVAALIVPLPPSLVDAGLAASLATGFVLLLTALFARETLELSSLPTLLLGTTLFRLALNVSSTRLALADGHAGQMIQAFGELVVRGDPVVGAVVFAVLSLVQFVVVAKGSERVAEVAARFTLDAMPGKQMSIDADLRAGLIDAGGAQRRRGRLERESQFFGAMDGAMKFVKGDVIVSLCICAVNLIGGTALGMTRESHSFGDAFQAYALIAIGDGLVSQLSSLCVAFSAGILVTRVAAEDAQGSLATEIAQSIFGRSNPLYLAAGACGVLALLPEMPHAAFLVVSGALAWVGYSVRATSAGAPAHAPQTGAGGPEPDAQPAEQGQVSTFDVGVTVALGPAWAERLMSARTEFSKSLELARTLVVQDLGVEVPPFQLALDSRLPPAQLRISIEGTCVDALEVHATMAVVLASPAELRPFGVQGIPITDAWTGRRCVAVASETPAVAELPRLEALEFFARQLAATLRRHAVHLMGVQETQRYLERCEGLSPALVREIHARVPLFVVAEVLKNLVSEGVSIRPVRPILEALVTAPGGADVATLSESARQALRFHFSRHLAPNGTLFAFVASPRLEDLVRRGRNGEAVDPGAIQRVTERAAALAGEQRLVVLTAPDTRRGIRRLLEGSVKALTVLAYGELAPETRVSPIGCLSIDAVDEPRAA